MICDALAEEAASSMLDPRSVSNLMLDLADRDRTAIDPVALQKLLYFAHGMYLLGTRKPLVSGYFEAWKNGPVHPGIYRAFRVAGNGPINFRATRENVLTGEQSSIPAPTDSGVIDLVRRVVHVYGPLDTQRLVAISHAPGAPWDVTMKQARDFMALGLRITDNVIISCFQSHKVSVDRGHGLGLGEPGEDVPPFT